MFKIQRILHDRAWIWILSSSVQLDMSIRRTKRLCLLVEHKKIKFISTSGHVIFCLLHKHTNGDVFDDFPKISDHFPKIFQNCSEGKTNVSEYFWEIFRRLPKFSEEAPMKFRSYSNTSKYFLRDYGTIAMVIILVAMATPISSHVKDKNSTLPACDEDMIF